MKRRAKELSKKEQLETLDALYTATSSLRDRKDMKLFLRDLLTESERIMLGRRILIARCLLAGTSAITISEQMKVGMDTIYKIERWLSDQFPGFEKALQQMEKQMEKRKRPEPFSFAYLKQKYPMHFLLFNIGEEIRNVRKSKKYIQEIQNRKIVP